ncbi:MAG: FecR domain-containing protein, partial [Bacteroidales bacterium]|nr:FecR domain-containing protein [Bacteroidales bacterium]
SSSASKGYFTLPDGSSVWLNRGSSLSYKGNLDGSTRKVSLEGEAFFDVSHNPDRPFIVQGKDMDITVTGTRFTVTSYPEQSGAVYLEEGSVTVKGEAFPETQLAPGQGIVFDDNTLSWKKVPIVAKDHTCWTQERLVFTNTALSDVFTSLEHWYHISVICPNREFLDKTRISMTVRQETPDNIFESIALLTGISYSREEGNRFVVRK